MSKRIFLMMLLLLSFLLTACGSDQSWDKEQVSEVSQRILSDDVKVKWELEDHQAPGQGTLIRLRITNNDKPIQNFEINHEKLLHLIIVSKDLSYFNHIHPEYKGKGVFEIVNDFPAGGEYRMVADFKPTDGGSMSKMAWVKAGGKEIQQAPVNVDGNLEKIVDGKRVALSIDSLEANKELTLKFSFTDDKTKQLITDLEPYLGSIGHVVVMSEDGERYLHVHALEDQGSGPKALFETTFPKSGIYKIWGQFQKDNQVFTVSYVVNVH